MGVKNEQGMLRDMWLFSVIWLTQGALANHKADIAQKLWAFSLVHENMTKGNSGESIDFHKKQGEDSDICSLVLIRSTEKLVLCQITKHDILKNALMMLQITDKASIPQQRNTCSIKKKMSTNMMQNQCSLILPVPTATSRFQVMSAPTFSVSPSEK